MDGPDNKGAQAALARNRAWVRWIAASALLVTGSTPSAAIEIFGFKFFEPAETETIELIDPLEYTVEVVADPEFESVAAAISGASVLVGNSDRPASGSSGLLTAARNDYSRIVDALYGLGRYGPDLSITINGAEAAALPFDVEITGPATVVITANAGPLYFFQTAGIENRHPGTELAATGFARGEVASSTAIRDAGLLAVEAWQNAGHAKASVAKADVIADHAKRRIEAVLTIDAGPQLSYGPLAVTGTGRVDHDFVRYMADLPAGAVYDPEQIGRGRQRLVDLDTFRAVDLVEGEVSGSTLPIEIALTDRLLRRFGIGASINSIDGVGLEGFWLHRNLFGRAERLRFDGAVQGIGRSSDLNDYDYSAIATFIKPGVFNPDTDLRTSFGAAYENQPNFSKLAIDAEAGLSTVFSKYLRGDANLIWERSRVDDDLGRRRFTLVGVEFALTFDDRDDPLDATRGTFAEATLFPFYERRYNGVAARAQVELRNYQTFGPENAVTVAGRAKVGSVINIPAISAPPQTLFFSGGGGSVRGYPFLSNGVTLANGNVVGGLSVVELSGEIRTRLNDRIGAVAFVDAGLVGAGTFPTLTDPWEVGVGAGLRWQTGLGPLRIDLARGLDLSGSDPEIALYIGLGQTF